LHNGAPASFTERASIADQGGAMTWEPPRFTELSMNAEIGAYQEDFDRGNPPIVDDESTSD
jgi:hypothetical protein